tara:strand:+ start:255 stop:881 length:627 start_codon:yes stop_codon:yes gene_type:complete
MGLLDKLSDISSKTGGLNAGLGQLSSMAKAAFCLPSIIAGAFGSIPSIASGVINGVVSGVANSIADITNNITATVQGAIQGVVDKINGTVGQLQSILGDVAATVQEINNFVGNAKDAIDDIRSFTSDKENCNQAGATLGKCIAQNAVLNVSANSLGKLAKQGADIENYASKIVGGQDSPINQINGFVNKQTAQLNKASKVINKINRLF